MDYSQLQGLTDIEIRALGLDPTAVRQKYSPVRTMDFRKGVDDLPEIGRDAEGNAYIGDPARNSQAVIRQTPDGQRFEYDQDGNMRILPKGNPTELLRSGPGAASPAPADMPRDPWAEQAAATEASKQRINDQFDPRKTPVSPQVQARAGELRRQGQARGTAETRQQRFKNDNAYGFRERNPQGTRSTPAGQHPLDQEAARFAERGQSRVAEPAAPPAGAVGAGSRAQFYADRAAPAEPAPSADSSGRPLYIGGEVVNPVDMDSMGWNRSALRVRDALDAAGRGIDREKNMAIARAINSRLPAEDRVDIPNGAVFGPSAPVPMEPTAAGAERIAKSKQRNADAEMAVRENAMANRASRRNRMGLVNPYISPEIRTLHRMGDDERDLRDRMAGDVAANRARELDLREKQITDEGGWRKAEIDARRQEAEANRKFQVEQQAQARKDMYTRQAFEAANIARELEGQARRAPNDPVIADRARQARANADALMKMAGLEMPVPVATPQSAGTPGQPGAAKSTPGALTESDQLRFQAAKERSGGNLVAFLEALGVDYVHANPQVVKEYVENPQNGIVGSLSAAERGAKAQRIWDRMVPSLTGPARSPFIQDQDTSIWGDLFSGLGGLIGGGQTRQKVTVPPEVIKRLQEQQARRLLGNTQELPPPPVGSIAIPPPPVY